MKPMVKTYLLDENGEKFFGEGPCQLLTEIQKTGSLRSAAGNLEMAYTKALKLLNRAEAALDYPLVTRAVGGRSGGGSTLTPEGEKMLTKYEAYRTACRAANEQIFQKIFGEKRLGCVIMASGLGTRFGGNKLMADFHGQPLICRILDATEALFAKRVVVTRHGDVAAFCEEKNIPVILHNLPGRDDTVRLGLEFMGEDVDGCLFCPGDQPLLSRASLEKMVQDFGAHPEYIHQLGFEDRAGTPVIFPKSLFEELRHLPQGRGGSVLIKKYPGQVRRVPAREECELWDVDTPEDLENIKKILSF